MSRRAISRRDLLKGSAVAAGTSAMGAAASAAEDVANSSSRADLALVNGRILTMDGKNTVASAVAIREGRIVEVGTRVGKAARTIDLKGATVIPGMIDTHCHLFMGVYPIGYEARGVEAAGSIKELLQAISDRTRTVPNGKFITCNWGWNHRGLAEKRLPTLAELNTAAPNHPVWLEEVGVGAAGSATADSAGEQPAGVTNSLGLAFFRQHGVNGDASTGLVSYAGSEVLQKLATEEDRRRAMNAAIDYALGLGVTMVHEVGHIVPDPALEATYPYVLDLWRRGQLKLRFRIRVNSPQGSGIEGLRARIVNSINRLGDDILRMNGIGEGVGDAEATDPRFVEGVKMVAGYGWSVHAHSVSEYTPGDLIEHTAHVAAYRAANAVRPLRELRWSLAHVNYITPEMVRELKEMGVGVTGDAWQYTEPLASVPMGPPWRTLVDSGINIGAGSDSTGTAGFNPWLTIYYMTTGRINTGDVANPGQALSRAEALKIYTQGSAWHSFDDPHLGTLEVGKLADLAVLSDDPLRVSDAELRRIRSKLTLQAGKVVYETA